MKTETFSECLFNLAFFNKVIVSLATQCLALSSHSKKTAGWVPGLGPVCVEFARSPCVCQGSLQGPQSKNMLVNWEHGLSSFYVAL